MRQMGTVLVPFFSLLCCHGLFGEFDFVSFYSYCCLSVEVQATVTGDKNALIFDFVAWAEKRLDISHKSY